jgi:hypothetical protein
LTSTWIPVASHAPNGRVNRRVHRSAGIRAARGIHYIVYEPLAERFIAVVAVIRQGRDIPAVLQKWSLPIRRELIEIRAKIARGDITWATRSAGSPRLGLHNDLEP